MILGAPQWSDVNPVYTHGWPRKLVKKEHGGFKEGNITCTARVTNVRIRSVAVQDVACFLSTEAIYASGLTLSNLLYLRQAAIQSTQKSYRMPVQLVNSSIAYGYNFATMKPLSRDTLSSIGEELFMPYWTRFIASRLADEPEVEPADDAESQTQDPQEESVDVPESTFNKYVTFRGDPTGAVEQMRGSYANTPAVPGVQRNCTPQQIEPRPHNRPGPTGKGKGKGAAQKTPQEQGNAGGGETNDGAGGSGAGEDRGQGDDGRGEQTPGVGTQAEKNGEDRQLDQHLPPELREKLRLDGLAYSKSPRPEQLDRVWTFMERTKPLRAPEVSAN